MGFEHIAWLYLWVGPHLLLAVVAVLMFRKGLHRDFPIFFTYLLFELLEFCVLFTWHFRSPAASTYMTVDAFSRAGDIALHFGILREIFEAPVTHSAPLRRTMAPFLNGATLLLVALALVFIGALDYSIFGDWGLGTYFTFEALNIAQCGLIVLVFLWHRFLGLRMSPFVFGVALGLGLIAASDPLVHALKGFVPLQFSRTVDFSQLGVYHLAVLVWLYYVQTREKIALDSDAALPRLIEQGAAFERIVQL